MKDYLLRFSFSPNNESLFIRNFHEILGSLIFYIIAYEYLSDYLIVYFFKLFDNKSPKNSFKKSKHLEKIYAKENFKEYLNFKIHIVAMFQCLISIALVFQNLFKQPMSLDITTYQDDYSTMVSSVTIGYFIWDLYICLRWYQLFHMEFLIHAVASLFVFTSAMKPFCQSWISKFLIFELSSPFVNVNWFISNILIKLLKIDNLPKIVNLINVVNGLLLISTFTFVRICWGFNAVAIMIYQIWKNKMYENPQFSYTLIIIILLINFALNCLNIMWLSKMLKIAKKMLKSSKKT